MRYYTVLFYTFLFSIIIAILLGCQQQQKSFSVDYEKYILDNGLEVILHEDHSDPIVAVASLVHAGSNREKPGRTGFAHFFEHMSFNDSENVPRGANRKMIPELGGTRNGGTWSDGTIYYEVIPTDAFEKILWIDSDRLGYMINTVTKEAMEREKQVVKNEKRQRVDNAPYGHTYTIIREHLYPEDHPYHWTTIGDLRDLQAATLDDVKEFYERYYGANNFTLVIAGDIDVAQTKALVEKWFGEIRRGPEVKPLPPMPVTLDQTVSLYHEDNFAKLPELRMVFPVVQQYHQDSYPLQVLGEVLSGSKLAHLYKVIVEEKKLAPDVSSYYDGSELAGEFVIRVRANADTDLDSVKLAIEEGLNRFETESFTENELKRVKAQIETDFYNSISTVLNKAFQLSIYNEFAGSPDYLTEEIRRMQSVTHGDVVDVYQRYIKNKPYVMTSFVPKGQKELIVDDSQEAEVYEEEIKEGLINEEVSQGEEAVYEKTPTMHDRSEPPLGEPPLLKTPAVWTGKLDNGVALYGIVNSEVPLVTFDLTLTGGHWLDPLDKAGVANLLSELMMEGTASKTPAELEEAIGLLGAEISINAEAEEIRITANTLSRNFEETLALMEEILLEPRWDAKEYERLMRELQTRLKGREASPTAISSTVYNRLLYGDKHILGIPVDGTLLTIKNISLDDLKDYYNKYFHPSLATFHIVGNVNEEQASKALRQLAGAWQPGTEKAETPQDYRPQTSLGKQVYFIDVPGAKQSVIRIGRLALSGKDEDHNNLEYANQIIGGGTSGRFFQLLRIEKGYTYGAYSRVGDTREIAPWTAATSVRANVTLESMKLMRELLDNYVATFGESEMELTKNKVIKGSTRSFESLSSKLNMLRHMSKFNLPADYVQTNQHELLGMSIKDFHNMIETYLNEDDMFYLVVGDAKTQLAQMKEFGYGEPVQLDVYGNPIN